jgi:FkbM family methyltransferase
MIPPPVSRWLASRPGPVGARASAYREWRWGDPYVRLLRYLCDSHRTSIDVGAHAGSYTWFLRRYSTRCIAFEPNPQLAAVLRRRFPAGVDVRDLALSDHPGKAVLRIPVRSAKPDPGRATIEADNLLAGASAILGEAEVEIVTLDQAIDEPIGFIKIDVEGHELKVLRGAERILAEHQPNMILELEDRHNPGIVAAAFAHLGERAYRGWFLEAARIVPISAFNPERHQNAQHPERWVNNFVFSTDPATGDRLRL